MYGLNLLDSFNIIKVTDKGKLEELTISKDELTNTIPTLEKRDFSIIDGRLNFKISSIITKKKTILIKLDYLKCIIYKKIAYFFVSSLNNRPQQLINFFDNLIITITNEQNINGFRLKILEEILLNVAEHFESEITHVAPKVNLIKKNLGNNSKGTILGRNFVDIHSNLLNLNLRIKDIYELFEEIDPDTDIQVQTDFHSDLNSDSDTDHIDKRLKKKELPKKVTQDKITITFEDIIDNYRIRFEDSYQNVEQMINIMDTSLKIYQTYLSVTRNKLTLYTLNLTIVAIFTSFASLVSGIFGMNVENSFEDSSHAIIVISIIMLAIVSTSFVIIKIFNSKF